MECRIQAQSGQEGNGRGHLLAGDQQQQADRQGRPGGPAEHMVKQGEVAPLLKAQHIQGHRHRALTWGRNDLCQLLLIEEGCHYMMSVPARCQPLQSPWDRIPLE